MAFVSNKPKLVQALRRSVSDGLNAAALRAQQFARDNMQRIPPRITAKGIFFGKKFAGGREVYPGAPPGTFPGVRTGNLRNSMVADLSTSESLKAAFGVFAGRRTGMVFRESGVSGTRGYAGWLEFGTRRMKARPWAMPTVRNAGMGRAFADTTVRNFGRYSQ